MLNSIKKYILNTKTIFSIKVNIEDNGYSYSVLKTIHKKNSLSIIDKIISTDFNNITDLLKSVKNAIIVLNIDGKGVLTKKITSKKNYKKEILFGNSPDDFEFYEYIQNNSIFVSFLRKDKLNKILSLFKEQNLPIVDLFIGSLNVVNLNLFTPNKKIHLPSKTFNFNDVLELNDIENIKNNTKNYIIGNETIPSTFLIEFSSILQWLSPNENFSYENNHVKKERDLFIQKKTYYHLSKFTIIFFFTSISISFILNKIISSKNQEFQILIQDKNNLKNKIFNIKNDIKNKELIINSTGKNSFNHLSFYSSEIGKTIPVNINLHELNIFPIKNNIRKNKAILIDTNHIKISGYTQNKLDFNEWIYTLKKMDWVEDISIINYSDKLFTILIKL